MRPAEIFYANDFLIAVAASEKRLWLKPEVVLCDFELAFMNAVAEVFPGSRIQGCLFHFTQSIWRYAVTECRLKKRYSEVVFLFLSINSFSLQSLLILS